MSLPKNDSQLRCPVAPASGFSMVELLVVLGIVALATAVLLPAVQTVRRTVATATCADNLRTLGQALTGYVNDHQFYPYGYYRADGTSSSGPLPDRGEDAASDQRFVWWSVLRSYVEGGGLTTSNGRFDDSVPFSRINALFNCPAATDRVNGVDYVPNAAVLVQRDIELGLLGHFVNKTRGTSLGRPNTVYSDTTLLWDAPEVAAEDAAPTPRKTQYAISYNIDAAPGTAKASVSGLLASPRKPSWRYRNVSSADRAVDPKNYADNTPIYPGLNQDVIGFDSNRSAGGIRFRHGANNEANFLFADGSVRAHTMTLNWNTTPTGTLLRKFFRSKLPPGHIPIDAPN